jgi:hypothetical protein
MPHGDHGNVVLTGHMPHNPTYAHPGPYMSWILETAVIEMFGREYRRLQSWSPPRIQCEDVRLEGGVPGLVRCCPLAGMGSVAVHDRPSHGRRLHSLTSEMGVLSVIGMLDKPRLLYLQVHALDTI